MYDATAVELYVMSCRPEVGRLPPSVQIANRESVGWYAAWLRLFGCAVGFLGPGQWEIRERCRFFELVGHAPRQLQVGDTTAI